MYARRYFFTTVIILSIVAILLVGKIYDKQKLYFSENYILGSTIDTEPFTSSMVVNPYLGFVYEYIGSNGVNKYGFYGSEPVFNKSNDIFVVGVFGGSVAQLYYFDQKETLVRKLSLIPSLTNKQIRVISVATGGFKQPQQLMALNYFLVLGAQFDAVVNIDGFNEVVLPSVENIPRGISSYFPRSWNLYARNIFDQKSMLLLSSLEKEKIYLTNLKNNYTKGTLRYFTFIYRYLYVRQQNRISDRQKELDTYLKSLPTNYQITGPEKFSLTEDKVLDNIIKIWEQSSRQMANLSKSNKILYLHILQPNQYLPGSKTLSDDEKLIAYSDDQIYRKPVEIFYPQLVKNGLKMKNDNINFIDLTDLFKDIKESVYIDNCCHINTLGNSLITEQIVAQISKQLK